MRKVIAILEDNADRVVEMKRWLSNKLPSLGIVVYHEPAEMIAWLDGHLDQIAAISLDHDLELMPAADGGWRDPGTGREVADFLATRTPSCPVIIHSTNALAAQGMESVLAETGWQVTRVVPYGDLEWIGETWWPAMQRCLAS